MSIQFECSSIDNNAIYLVINQLLPYLKYEPASEFRVLNLDDDGISEKHIILYKEVYLPYCAESKKHHLLHHSGGAFYPDSWIGEQACLSMIHYLNQKAWWFLYYFATEDVVKKYCDIKKDLLERVSSRTTHNILDGGMSIGAAVDGQMARELKLDDGKKEMIVHDIAQTIEEYKDAPSFPLTYR